MLPKIKNKRKLIVIYTTNLIVGINMHDEACLYLAGDNSFNSSRFKIYFLIN